MSLLYNSENRYMEGIMKDEYKKETPIDAQNLQFNYKAKTFKPLDAAPPKETSNEASDKEE